MASASKPAPALADPNVKLTGNTRKLEYRGEGKTQRNKRSDALQHQARNAAKIPEVAGADRIAELQSTGADQQIGQRKVDSFARLFPTHPSCDLSSCFGDWVNRHGGPEFIEEGAATVAKLRCVGAVDTVADFRNADCAQYNRDLAIACSTLSTAWAAVRFRRSAAIRALESRTNPWRAGSMAGAEP